jgi:hypothetical protein
MVAYSTGLTTNSTLIASLGVGQRLVGIIGHDVANATQAIRLGSKQPTGKNGSSSPLLSIAMFWTVDVRAEKMEVYRDA